MTGIQNEVTKFNRNDLIQELKNYTTDNESETSYIPRFLELLTHDNCFLRTCFPAHITGSALLLNQSGDKILMNYHKSLNRWLSFGGHADGEEDIFNVAIRETMEESGLTSFKPISPSFIDLDIHEIPANDRKNEPAHFHYDVRYVMQMTGHQEPVISDESVKLEWMTFDDAIKNTKKGDSLIRLIKKVQKL